MRKPAIYKLGEAPKQRTLATKIITGIVYAVLGVLLLGALAWAGGWAIDGIKTFFDVARAAF